MGLSLNKVSIAEAEGECTSDMHTSLVRLLGELRLREQESGRTTGIT